MKKIIKTTAIFISFILGFIFISYLIGYSLEYFHFTRRAINGESYYPFSGNWILGFLTLLLLIF
jgi:hypothetical protein